MIQRSGSATDARQIVEAASVARLAIRRLSGDQRSALLHEIARSIRSNAQTILSANARDMNAAVSLSAAMRDRLMLNDGRVESIASAVESIANQPDPVGKVIEQRVLRSGIKLEKRRVPLGVVLVIYESRPNVTVDAAALCLKAGNAVVLKGGREAIESSSALAECMDEPLQRAGVAGAVAFIRDPDREVTGEILGMADLIDLAIPRGGPGLMRFVSERARMPVIKHDAGVCHVYIDAELDELADDAVAIVINAKTQRPGVCNAIETLLVHENLAETMLPVLGDALTNAGVEIRGDQRACALIPGCLQATEEDWPREYLDLIVAVRVVASLEEACEHIRRHGSGHTDAIVTSSKRSADRFVALVDSASVMVNCSTRFADGAEYGLGAEIGISTEKLHARGPMGAEDLTTFQWVLEGEGQIRD